MYNYDNNNNNFKIIKPINVRQLKATKIIPSVFRRHTQYALQRCIANGRAGNSSHLAEYTSFELYLCLVKVLTR
jgi:hypothetical protein